MKEVIYSRSQNGEDIELPRRKKRKDSLGKKLRTAQRSGCTYRDLQVAESVELYARVDPERFLQERSLRAGHTGGYYETRYQ